MDISFLELSSPPSPKQDHPIYYPYGSYPSPPFATDGFHFPAAHAVMTPPPPPPKVVDGDGERVARKDRHSKICTAGGMRDRRMRLSLDVARRFFALQDKLGFDKASKTVQWLLDTSKAGIRELMSADCECEDGSSLSEAKRNEQADSAGERRPKAKRATPKATRKANAHVALPDKESRARARERARERTREKCRLRWATLASSISVQQAPSSQPQGEGSCDELHRRMQEVSMASESSDVIPAAFERGHSSDYYHQDQWELSGVVFANPRFH